jgi:Domain of Unknown Function with PDB structure (DUF3862)
MKNSLNMVIVVFVLIVLGCSCPKMDDIQKKIDESAKKTTNNSDSTVANTATAPKQSTETANLTKAKYEQIKTGMKYSAVKDIIGEEGEEMSSTESGKYKIQTYKWSGEDFSYIIATFMNDKMQSKAKSGNLK